MEIIIGRESGQRRIHCIVDGTREFFLGQAGIVPSTVSREHCKLILNGDQISLSNIKERNITFVDGNQVLSKNINATSVVELGTDHFKIPLQQIIQLAKGQKPAPASGSDPQTNTLVFSLTPLSAVWDEYNERNLSITDKAAKSANRQRLQGILSMLGMCVGFIESIPKPIRITIIILALLIAVYFFVKGMISSTVQRQINELNDEYADKYKCPNPKCNRPFGNVPYRNIEYMKGCPACGCRYTRE